jgi:hypothetical protein
LATFALPGLLSLFAGLASSSRWFHRAYLVVAVIGLGVAFDALPKPVPSEEPGGFFGTIPKCRLGAPQFDDPAGHVFEILLAWAVVGMAHLVSTGTKQLRWAALVLGLGSGLAAPIAARAWADETRVFMARLHDEALIARLWPSLTREINALWATGLVVGLGWAVAGAAGLLRRRQSSPSPASGRGLG